MPNVDHVERDELRRVGIADNVYFDLQSDDKKLKNKKLVSERKPINSCPKHMS